VGREPLVRNINLSIHVAFLQAGCSRVTPALPVVFDSESGYLSTVM
jgi:hypothetical protein